MTNLRLLAAALGCSFLAGGQTLPVKVGIMHSRQSIIRTTDGQKAMDAFRQRFEEAQRQFQKRQAEVEAMQTQLQNSRNVMAPEAQAKLQRDIEARTRALARDKEELEADFNQEQSQIVLNLKAMLGPVIARYAQQNGFALVIDIDVPNSPVLFAATGVDITEDLARFYEQTASASKSSGPAPAKP